MFGRLGVLDVFECVLIFGVFENLVIGIIVGGDRVLRIVVEGVEDDEVVGVNDFKVYNFNEKDFVVGLIVSGCILYVMVVMKYVCSIGVKVVGIIIFYNVLLF